MTTLTDDDVQLTVAAAEEFLDRMVPLHDDLKQFAAEMDLLSDQLITAAGLREGESLEGFQRRIDGERGKDSTKPAALIARIAWFMLPPAETASKLQRSIGLLEHTLAEVRRAKR